MRNQLERRLDDLKSEFQSGQKLLAELEAKQANLHETLLRISGAIQVLEEELAIAGARDASAVEGGPGNGRPAAEPTVYGVGEQSART